MRVTPNWIARVMAINGGAQGAQRDQHVHQQVESQADHLGGAQARVERML